MEKLWNKMEQFYAILVLMERIIRNGVAKNAVWLIVTMDKV